MDNMNWNYPTSIWFGFDRIKDIQKACNDLNIKNPLIVTDPGIQKTDIIKKINSFLNAESQIYAEVKSNPTGQNVMEGVKYFNNGNHDGVIAVGGGSGMDTGKGIAFMSGQNRPIWDFEDIGDYWTRANSQVIKPIIAIPTTAGTGSEFTHTSVYKTKQNIKNWLWDELTFFDYVIYIPSFTMNLPKYFTISSGIDAFDHLIESLLSLKFDFKNLELCNSGLEAIWYSLPKLVENTNDIDERKKMILGSGIAGKAIHYTGCGICHCIAHTLGSLTNVPHGVAVAYGLLHTIEPVLINNKDLLERFREPFINLSAEELSIKIKDWIKRLEINFEIIENKVDFNKFIEVYYLKDNESMRNNTYYQPSKNDLKKLLNKLWK